MRSSKKQTISLFGLMLALFFGLFPCCPESASEASVLEYSSESSQQPHLTAPQLSISLSTEPHHCIFCPCPITSLTHIKTLLTVVKSESLEAKPSTDTALPHTSFSPFLLFISNINSNHPLKVLDPQIRLLSTVRILV